MYDLHIRILPFGPMGLVDDHANNFPYVAPTGIDVIVDRLGRTEEEAPLLPVPGPIVFIDGVAHNLGGMLRRDAHNVEARRKLLRHERFGRGAEHDLPRREPSVVVVHGRCSDERLAKSGGERHQRVVVDGRLRRLELVVSHRMVGIVGVDPGLDGLLVDRHRSGLVPEILLRNDVGPGHGPGILLLLLLLLLLLIVWRHHRRTCTSRSSSPNSARPCSVGKQRSADAG